MNREKSAHAALAIVLLLLCTWLLIRVQIINCDMHIMQLLEDIGVTLEQNPR